jgi:single-strand DNA-binding protein
MKTGTFAGRIGQKAVTRSTGNDQSVTNFSIAVDRGKDRESGEKNAPLWIKAAIWGKRGEKLAQYLTPGTIVSVSGDIDLDSYEKEGNTITQIKVRVDQLSLLGGGKKDEDADDNDGCPI